MENSIWENWILTTLWNIYTKLLKKPLPNIKFKYIPTKEFKKKIITFIKSSNSHGYDEIYTRILKASSQFIISPITYICKQSLS